MGILYVYNGSSDDSSVDMYMLYTYSPWATVLDVYQGMYIYTSTILVWVYIMHTYLYGICVVCAWFMIYIMLRIYPLVCIVWVHIPRYICGYTYCIHEYFIFL